MLELGGYNPLIVLADADLEYAVNATAFGAFLHQGQICMSARRIIVERPIADEFVSRLVEKTNGLKAGDPNEHDTIIGPLINEGALEMVKRRVDAAVKAGAKVLAGGERRRAVLPRDAARRRAAGLGVRADGDVRPGRGDRDRRQRRRTPSQRANASSYGLSSGIITQDVERGLALAGQIDAGIVHVNDQPVGDEPQMPFGGVKDSGFGRFGGTAVVDEFTELRWVTVQRGSHPFPF